MISNELIKYLDNVYVEFLIKLFNVCLNGVHPWKESIITPLHKKVACMIPVTEQL